MAEQPEDATPYLRLARIHRDLLSDDARAAHWLRRSLREASLHDGLRRLIRRELLEIWDVRMGEPSRAIPLLVQIAEEEEATDEGAWAKGELSRVRGVAGVDDQLTPPPSPPRSRTS